MARIDRGSDTDGADAERGSPTYINLGNGDDAYTAPYLTYTVLNGGNGDDTITIGSAAPHGQTSYNLTVHGGNGDDTIFVRAIGGSVFGENGADTISVLGSGERVEGGRGDDHITVELAYGQYGNHVFGGPGDDVIVSISPPIANLVSGNELTGGPGDDTFDLTSPINFSFVGLALDADGDTQVSAGDVVAGNFNVVTDYGGGDVLRLGATTALQDTTSLSVPDGAYLVLHGDLESGTLFAVREEGSDLLVVFDSGDGIDNTLQGSVVLLGVTDAASLVIA